jgi:hypothetical protein
LRNESINDAVSKANVPKMTGLWNFGLADRKYAIGISGTYQYKMRNQNGLSLSVNMCDQAPNHGLSGISDDAECGYVSQAWQAFGDLLTSTEFESLKVIVVREEVS